MFREDMERQIKQLKKELKQATEQEKKEELKQLIKDCKAESIFLPTRQDLEEYQNYHLL